MMNNTINTINDLRTGDLVICAKGKKATVMKNTGREDVLRFHTKENSFLRIAANYNDDLTSKKSAGFDIVKVYRAVDAPANKIGDMIFNPDKMIAEGTVVYDRNAVTLKTGDLLVHRNGKRSTVFIGAEFGDITRFHTDFNSFSYLKRYDADFKHESNDGYDIVAIYRVADTNPTTFGDSFFNPEIMEIGANLIWSRDAAEPDDDEQDDCDYDDDSSDVGDALDALQNAVSRLAAAIG